MKKFDIKKLMILVLALMMVFALVACNKDNGGEDPNPTPTPTPSGKPSVDAATYFQELWNATKSIGNDAIGEDDAIKIELGLDIALEANGGDPFDLGVLLGIVYDPSGAQSGAKVKLYDKATTENWLTLYLFMSEPDMLYISFKDQNVAIPFDTDGSDNGTYATAVKGFIGSPVLDADKDNTKKTSIADLIADVAGEFGSDWTLDSLLGQVLGLLGVNLGDLVAMIPESLLGDMTEEELAELAESPSLLPVLKGLGGTLFPGKIPYVVEDGVTTYTASVGSDLMALVPTLVGSYVGNLITADSALELIFAKNADGSINNFAIHLHTDNYSGENPFDLKLTIDSLKIESLGADIEVADAQSALGFKAADFKANSRLDLDLEIGIAGNAVVLNPGETAADLDGYYKLHLEGQLNLNEGENTQAYAYIAYKTTANEEYVNLVEAAFSPDPADATKSQLALSFNSEHPMTQAFMTYVGPAIVKGLAGSSDSVVSAAGVLIANAAYGEYVDAAAVAAAESFTFDTTFKGVVLENLDLDELFQGLFIKDEGGAGTAAEEWQLDIAGLISTVIGALGYKDGVVSVSVDEGSGTRGGIANLIAGIFKKPANNASAVLFGTTDGKIDGIFGANGNAVLNKGLTSDEADDYGWWYTFFAGSAWAVAPAGDTTADKLAAEKATITNLFNSGVELTINNKSAATNPNKGEIKLAVTNDDASIDASLLINLSEADSAYVATKTLRPATSVIAADAADGIYEGWVLLSMPTPAAA